VERRFHAGGGHSGSLESWRWRVLVVATGDGGELANRPDDRERERARASNGLEECLSIGEEDWF
jgi:hypothetical protein